MPSIYFVIREVDHERKASSDGARGGGKSPNWFSTGPKAALLSMPEGTTQRQQCPRGQPRTLLGIRIHLFRLESSNPDHRKEQRDQRAP